MRFSPQPEWGLRAAASIPSAERQKEISLYFGLLLLKNKTFVDCIIFNNLGYFYNTMRLYFLVFTLALSQISFSQSKKEQIVILTTRIDSLYQVVSLERKINDSGCPRDKALHLS